MPPMARPPLIQAADVDLAYAAGQKVVETHRRIAAWLHPEVTLAEIDRFVAGTLDDLDCKSCFLGYRVPRSPAFPSHACLSLNDCVVHGTAGYLTRPITSGDVLKIDIGVTYKGWIGDAAWTYLIGEVSDEVRRLADCGKEALRRGVEQLQPGKPYIGWARAVQGYVEGECGFHLVRGLGGHGYGRKLHQPPFIANTVPLHPAEWPDAMSPALPGTLLAVEPMIAIGTPETRQRSREWPVFTADGSLSVHHEHDVLITVNGPQVLTEGLDDIDDHIR